MILLLPFAAAIALCGGGPRHTCVIDGDTFWLDGAKIRLADINAPETGQAACPAERAAGEAAKLRLAQLLGAGPYRLETRGRATDRYGRALRVVTRGGLSLGAQLVAEGHAEVWQGTRSDWCIRLAGGLPSQ